MVKKGSWALLATLTLLNVLNIADRYLIIGFSTDIIREFNLSNLQFGLLTGFVFTAVYTVVGIFAGALADRIDRTYVIGAGLVLWSSLTAATGLVKNFSQMALARMFIGVGEGCLTPAAVSMLCDSFPASRRALVSGIYSLGLPIGLGGAFIAAGALGPILGWRGTFGLLGALGVVLGILVMIWVTDPPREVPLVERRRYVSGERMTAARRRELQQWALESLKRQAEQQQAQPAYGAWLLESFKAMAHMIFRNPAFGLTVMGGTAFAFVLSAGVFDLVWWVEERGYDQAQAKKLLGAMLIGGGILGALLGGWGGDWAYKRFPAGRLKFLGWVMLLAVPLMAAYRLIPGHTPAFYSLALVGASLSMLMFGPIYATLQEQVPPQHRGAAIGVFLLFGVLLGGSAGAATVGFLADAFKTMALTEPVSRAMLTMSLVGILPVPAFFLAARHHQQQAGSWSGAQPVTAPT